MGLYCLLLLLASRTGRAQAVGAPCAGVAAGGVQIYKGACLMFGYSYGACSVVLAAAPGSAYRPCPGGAAGGAQICRTACPLFPYHFTAEHSCPSSCCCTP